MRGYAGIVSTFAITILLWILAKQINPAMSFAHGATQISALLGIMALCLSFVLATRAKFLEKMFGGLDVIYKIHHILGGSALILLINHALLLIVDSMPANTLSLYLVPSTTWSYTYGIISLYIMLILVVLTIYVYLPYRYWKWSHEWMGLTIVFGGLHAMLISSDTSSFMPLRVWILFWAFVATVSFVYKRFIYYFVDKRLYKIVRIGSKESSW